MFEARRGAALRQALLRLLAGIVLASVVIAALRGGDLWALGWMVAIAIVILAAVAAARPLGKLNRDFAGVGARALAEANGLAYAAADFELPGYDAARPLFFPFAPGEQFTHACSGSADGRHFSLCQANFQWPELVMQGQLFTFESRAAGPGVIVIRPNGGLLSLSPERRLGRSRFPEDPEFDKRFQVHAANPAQAAAWLDASRRALLVQLWNGRSALRRGQVYAWFDGNRALLFSGDADLIRVESRFSTTDQKARSERIRAGFDAGMARLEALMRAFG